MLTASHIDHAQCATSIRVNRPSGWRVACAWLGHRIATPAAVRLVDDTAADCGLMFSDRGVEQSAQARQAHPE